MPIFEYVCKDCRHEFEALVFGKQKAECPKCHGQKLEPQLSVFAVSSKGGTASQRSFSAGSPSGGSSSGGPGGACGSCGDPRGAGACSLPDLD